VPSFIVKMQQISYSWVEIQGKDPGDALRNAKYHHDMKPECFTWKKGEVHAIDVDSEPC
jgi:hypothetical protein